VKINLTKPKEAKGGGMERTKYDKQLIRWVKNHYWDSLEKDKDLILRHLRTFAGDEKSTLRITDGGKERCDARAN